MSEKFPPHSESHTSRKNSGEYEEYSDLLDELVRIRKDIEQESTSTCHLAGLVPNQPKDEKNSTPSYITNEVIQNDKSLCSSSFRRFYRFDPDHLEREDTGFLNVDSIKTDLLEPEKFDTRIPHRDKDILYHQELGKTTEKPHQFSQFSKSKNFEIKKNQKRYDDEPVVIPIHRPETRTPARNSKFCDEKHYAKTRHDNHHLQNDPDNSDVTDFTAIPWGLINQYENENFVNMTGNAGNLSLFIGWGAIACGVVIFARSFFVSSMIWLNYGLPIVALGAACLFLGIILSILSDKMQHINDLKQSMTAHRILNSPTNNNAPPSGNHNEHAELEDVYNRLVRLRSEINELIDECENP
jgi:hypothetical protein